MLEATDSWAYNIDIGNINAVIFRDLKKAFDTVGHGLLLSKLDFYGTSENLLKWFQSYLEKRIQQCSVGGSLSDSRIDLWCPSRDHPRSTLILIISQHENIDLRKIKAGLNLLKVF